MNECNVCKLYQSITEVREDYILEAGTVPATPRKRQRVLLAVACLLLAAALCGFGYVFLSRHWGVGAAEGVGLSQLTAPFSTQTTEDGALTGPAEGEGNSALLPDTTGLFADHTVTWSLTEEGEIPALYFSPGYLVILTQAGEADWFLQAGEELALDLVLREEQTLMLEVGYVFQGAYHSLSAGMGNRFQETLRAAVLDTLRTPEGQEILAKAIRKELAGRQK